MTRTIIAAAAIAMTTPAFAGPQTLLEIRKHFAADDSGNEAVIYDGQNRISPDAARIHANIAARDDTGNMGTTLDASDFLSGSGSIVNAKAARILSEMSDDGSDTNN